MTAVALKGALPVSLPSAAAAVCGDAIFVAQSIIPASNFGGAFLRAVKAPFPRKLRGGKKRTALLAWLWRQIAYCSARRSLASINTTTAANVGTRQSVWVTPVRLKTAPTRNAIAPQISRRMQSSIGAIIPEFRVALFATKTLTIWALGPGGEGRFAYVACLVHRYAPV